MANICTNELISNEISRNTAYEIINFIEENFNCVEAYYSFPHELQVTFESKWHFPKKLMNEMYNSITNKEELSLVCLSVEWGNLYCEFLTCDENGWKSETY